MARRVGDGEGPQERRPSGRPEMTERSERAERAGPPERTEYTETTEPRGEMRYQPMTRGEPGRAPAALGPEAYTRNFWDQARWGPVVAGLVTALATLVLLSVLGLAVGLSAFEPTEVGQDVATGAAVYGAVIAIIAFLVGGFVAGWTAKLFSPVEGAFNGFLVGAVALVLVLWLTTTGAANLLGAVGTNLQEIADVAAGGEAVAGFEPGEALADAEARFADAERVAWGTFAGIAIALAAAAVGGFLGFMVNRGTRDDEMAYATTTEPGRV
jgi:hypothetical protein